MRAGGGGGAWEGPLGAGLPRRPRTLPPGLGRAGAWPGDRAARRGTQGARAGLHSGPVSSAVPEAPGLTHRTARTQTQAPHHVRHPTQQTRTAPQAASPTRPPGAVQPESRQPSHVGQPSARLDPRSARAALAALLDPPFTRAARRAHAVPARTARR